MGILSRLLRREPVAAAPRASWGGMREGMFYDLSDPALGDFLRAGTASASGALVNPDSVLAIAAVHRCVTLLAGAVAQLPLNLMRSQDGISRQTAKDHPVHILLGSRPNRWQTSFEFRQMMQAHVLLRGNAFAHVVRVGARVIELIPLHPDRVSVKQESDLSITYRYARGNGQAETVYSQREVLHLRDISADGVVGLSRVAKMREAAGLALRTEEFGARLFKNGLKAGAVLKHPNKLSPDAVERLKASMAEREGAENAHRTLVLEEGMGIESLGLTGEDSQFLQTRAFQRSEIAMFFGVPPHLIGDTDRSTSWGSGIEQQNIGFMAFTLAPILASWEQALSRDLLTEAEARTLYPHFVAQGFMRAAAKDRAEFYAKALGSGGSPAWMTPNEIRALEDLNPVPGGDELPRPAPAQPAPAQPAPAQPAPAAASTGAPSP